MAFLGILPDQSAELRNSGLQLVVAPCLFLAARSAAATPVAVCSPTAGG
ncbi:MAG: hypothetical protein ACLSAF_05410 [Intestinimonas sp.]